MSFGIHVPIEYVEGAPLIGEATVRSYLLVAASGSSDLAEQFVTLRVAAIPLTVLLVVLITKHPRMWVVYYLDTFSRSYLSFLTVAVLIMSIASGYFVLVSPDALNVTGGMPFSPTGPLLGLIQYWFVFAMFLPWVVAVTYFAGVAMLIAYAKGVGDE